MDIQSILTEIERDERAFAQKHGGSRATLERLSVVSYGFINGGDPLVQTGFFSDPGKLSAPWKHKGNLHEHIGKHVVVIRDSVGNVVRLIGLVDKAS